jgi:hypothetical protein
MLGKATFLLPSGRQEPYRLTHIDENRRSYVTLYLLSDPENHITLGHIFPYKG